MAGSPSAGSGVSSFRRRIVTSTALSVAGLVAVVGLVLHLLLDATAGRDVRELLQARATASVQLIEDASRGSRLRVPATALDPGTGVYDLEGRPVAGGVPRQSERDAAELVASGATGTASGGDDVRLLAAPVLDRAGERIGTVVVSQDTDPYERSEGYVTAAIIVLGLLATAIAAVVAGRVARRALAPVTIMAERAADWSAHDLSHRFDLGPPTDELTTLAATLDRLLDRVALAIRSEQRLTAELAHELRTPLAGIRGSADLALLRARGAAPGTGVDAELRADLEAISASAQAMGEVITTLLDLARHPDAPDASCLLADVVERVQALAPDGVRVAIDLHHPQRIAGPADVVATALMPLVENAVRHARSHVEITATSSAGAVVVRVGDDGTGVTEELRDRIFDPGSSGADGTGLGLAIARRAARSIGGEVRIGDPGPEGTTVFELRLPTLPLSPGGS
ncbi:HAMP domain-containing sensor histidine kinase [Nocardioides fonticola]|uniref:histidine kinase n=1 Tax=Nocardioides fonticola TaxID=450363 RepID=A0ABP7XA41_9ACTN